MVGITFRLHSLTGVLWFPDPAHDAHGFDLAGTVCEPQSRIGEPFCKL
jgi:hypothetical protein